MRLGLPPLGILGIPMTITGTQDNPKVKLGKQTEDLQETECSGRSAVRRWCRKRASRVCRLHRIPRRSAARRG